MGKTKILLMLLVAAVLVSALGVVNAKHKNRFEFSQLQLLLKQKQQIEIEWGQLQLEQATWATHGRIEEMARGKLEMQLPSLDKVEIIRP